MRAAEWGRLDRSDFRERWEALSSRAAEPNPFFDSWHLMPALRRLDPDGACRLLCGEADGALLWLLPVVRQRRYYRWPLHNLASWLHANAFLGAPLVAKGYEAAFWRALFAWADANARAALFVHLTQLPLGGPLDAALHAVCAEQGRKFALVHREERAMLASDHSPAAYFEAALSGKKRKELRRQFARLSELGTVAVERQTDAEGLESWTDAFLALERSGWKGAAGSAMGSHLATSDLFREALTGAAERNKLERLTLRLDGAPIAMLATLLAPPGAFAYKTAFDERFARFSPGVLLQRENLAVLANPAIAWSDSCASADHPMIDHVWRERRAIGRYSVAIGGPVRRGLFAAIAHAETRRNRAECVA
ncbi:MAG: GNAT family N-acetyltransferase [Novosphingobium sp.]